MQGILIISVFLFSLQNIGCRNSEMQSEAKVIRDSASFIVLFDKTTQDKDGFYLNGYVVPIPFGMIDSLNGKMIEVSGIVTIHKGADEYMKEYGDVVQARSGPSKYIINPVIKIVSSKLKTK